MRLCFYLFISWQFFLCNAAYSQVSSGDAPDFSEMVDEEALKLSRFVPFDVKVRISDSVNTIAMPGGHIYMAERELRAIQEAARGQLFRTTVRLSLAHEFSHLIQMKYWGENAVVSADFEQRKVLECQADILAGKYLIESMQEPHMNGVAPQMNGNTNESIIEALSILYAIGSENSGFTDHPDKNQRVTAVRLGMAAGTIINFTNFLSDPYCPANVKNLVQGSMMRLASSVNYDNNYEDVFAWSYRIACQIAHFSREYSPDIIFSRPNTTRISTAYGPAIQFSVPYRNTGTRTLRLACQVQSRNELKSDPGNIKRELLQYVQAYKVDVGPGGHGVLEGSLLIEENDTLRYKMQFPADDHSMLSVYPAGEGIPAIVPRELSSTSLAFGSLYETEEITPVALMSSIDNIVADAREKFRNLRNSCGRQKGNIIEYNCLYHIPGASSTIIRYSADSTWPAYVKGAIISKVSLAQARATYEQYLSATEEFTGSEQIRREGDPRSGRAKASFENNGCDVNLSLLNKGENFYSVEIEINEN